jgi:hypothetical protein
LKFLRAKIPAKISHRWVMLEYSEANSSYKARELDLFVIQKLPPSSLTLLRIYVDQVDIIETGP